MQSIAFIKGIFHRAMCVLLVAVLIPSTGCGAMFSGSTTAIPVKTNPEGAKVYLNGEYVGKSPQVLSVKSKEKHMVDLTFRGYDVGLFCDFYWEQSEITHKFYGGSFISNDFSHNRTGFT